MKCKCGSIGPFYKNDRYCKVCRDARHARWVVEHREYVRATQRALGHVYSKAVNERACRGWRLRNPGASVRYRTAVQQAKVAWADAALISDIYEYAYLMREAGVICNVDHIVPLRGRTVSGLHTHDNLTVLLKSANSAKGNRYWPDQP